MTTEEINNFSLKTKEYDHQTWVRCCETFPKVKRAVSGDSKGTLRIFHGETFKLLKEIVKNASSTNHILRWKDDTALIADESSNVISFLIIEPYQNIKEFPKFERPVVRLAKISDDLFIAWLDDKQVTIYSYSTMTLHKRLTKIDLTSGFKYVKNLVVSKTHKNCVYLNTDGIPTLENQVKKIRKDYVPLLNYEQDFVLRVYQEHKQEIYSLSMFHKGSEEYLVCGGKYIFVYNTSPGEENKIIQRIPGTQRIYAMLVLGDNYIVAGIFTGEIRFYNISEPLNSPCFMKEVTGDFYKVDKNKVHRGWIYDLRFLWNTKDGDMVIVSAGGGDNCLKKSVVQGLKPVEDHSFNTQWRNDCKERFEFIDQNQDDFIFNEDERKTILFNINLRNFNLQNICRGFLLC